LAAISFWTGRIVDEEEGAETAVGEDMSERRF
jgi:hypothetical protein